MSELTRHGFHHLYQGIVVEMEDLYPDPDDPTNPRKAVLFDHPLDTTPYAYVSQTGKTLAGAHAVEQIHPVCRAGQEFLPGSGQIALPTAVDETHPLPFTTNTSGCLDSHRHAYVGIGVTTVSGSVESLLVEIHDDDHQNILGSALSFPAGGLSEGETNYIPVPRVLRENESYHYHLYTSGVGTVYVSGQDNLPSYAQFYLPRSGSLNRDLSVHSSAVDRPATQRSMCVPVPVETRGDSAATILDIDLATKYSYTAHANDQYESFMSVGSTCIIRNQLYVMTTVNGQLILTRYATADINSAILGTRVVGTAGAYYGNFVYLPWMDVILATTAGIETGDTALFISTDLSRVSASIDIPCGLVVEARCLSPTRCLLYTMSFEMVVVAYVFECKFVETAHLVFSFTATDLCAIYGEESNITAAQLNNTLAGYIVIVAGSELDVNALTVGIRWTDLSTATSFSGMIEDANLHVGTIDFNNHPLKESFSTIYDLGYAAIATRQFLDDGSGVEFETEVAGQICVGYYAVSAPGIFKRSSGAQTTPIRGFLCTLSGWNISLTGDSVTYDTLPQEGAAYYGAVIIPEFLSGRPRNEIVYCRFQSASSNDSIFDMDSIDVYVVNAMTGEKISGPTRILDNAHPEHPFGVFLYGSSLVVKRRALDEYSTIVDMYINPTGEYPGGVNVTGLTTGNIFNRYDTETLDIMAVDFSDDNVYDSWEYQNYVGVDLNTHRVKLPEGVERGSTLFHRYVRFPWATPYPTEPPIARIAGGETLLEALVTLSGVIRPMARLMVPGYDDSEGTLGYIDRLLHVSGVAMWTDGDDTVEQIQVGFRYEYPPRPALRDFAVITAATGARLPTRGLSCFRGIIDFEGDMVSGSVTNNYGQIEMLFSPLDEPEHGGCSHVGNEDIIGYSLFSNQKVYLLRYPPHHRQGK